MVIALTVIFVVFCWVIVKLVKTSLLLSRYNFRNGFKDGVNSKKAGFKEIKQRVADAKAWDKQIKAEVNKR